jgi:hypothetical protein
VKFDIYGRFQVEVVREAGAWAVYQLDLGKRSREDSFVIPPSLATDEIAAFLDDMYHELARPGQRVRALNDA